MTGTGLFFRVARLAAVAGTVLALAGCYGIGEDTGVTVTHTGQNADTPDAPVPAGTDPSDYVVGRRESPKIIATYGGVYSDRKAEIYLAHMVGKLLTAASEPDMRYTVTILDSPQVNAFALPGGFIFVTRGILALANDASELAAIVAHEIGHVALRHAQARAERVKTSQIVDKVITNVLGGNLETDQTAQRSKISFAAFSQAQEFAADKFGITTEDEAGYDPTAAARFLSAMGRFQDYEDGGQNTGDDFLSSHPTTPERIDKANKEAAQFPPGGDTDRAGYLKAIDGITFGDSPAQGVVVGQRFIHPGLKFTFVVPRNYKLQTSQSAVVGIGSDGAAVRFDSADVPQSMALVDYLKSGWIAGLQEGTVKPFSHDGIDMAGAFAKTDKWVFRVAVARLDGHVFRFIFAAKADSPAFEKAVTATVESFRPATDKDLAKIHRQVIRLVTAKPGDNADTLARQMAPIKDAHKLFYVLNNLYPGDPVHAGWQYKVVAIE